MILTLPAGVLKTLWVDRKFTPASNEYPIRLVSGRDEIGYTAKAVKGEGFTVAWDEVRKLICLKTTGMVELEVADVLV